MSQFRLGRGSEAMLVGVGRIAVVTRRAIQLCDIDFCVKDGLRNPTQQKALVANGSSLTQNSAHLYGKAVDLDPYLGPGVSPFPKKGEPHSVVAQKLRNYELISAAMFEAADELEFPLQWGNDWDIDGIPTGRDPDEKGWLQDLRHFQEAPLHRMKQAEEARLRRMHLRASGAFVIA